LHRIDGRKTTFTAIGSWAILGAFVAALAVGAVETSVAASSNTDADDSDRVHFYVSDQETYDSNLYRLPSYLTDVASLVAPNATRQDYINTVYLGVDGQWTLAQQAIGLNLRLNDNRFAHNTELNNNAGNADLVWNWHLGSNFSGQVGGDYARSLASFAETLYLGRDLDSTDYFATARYQLGPRWAVYGGVRDAGISNSAVVAQVNDFKSSSGNAGIEYAVAVDTTVHFEYRYTNALFPHGYYLFDGVPFDRNFNEDTESFQVKYVLSDKTEINASAGYLKRDYTHESIGAFSGDIWRVSLKWQATEKTQSSFAIWRDLEAYLASESNYFVSTGASISSVWVASEKLTFSLAVSSIDQKYISSSPTVVTLGSRHDKVNAQQASIIYTPTRALTVNLSFRNERRDSNQAQVAYDDKLATAALTFKF
jgi:exopolysaccharide biosynthesis operon protein EpsL